MRADPTSPRAALRFLALLAAVAPLLAAQAAGAAPKAAEPEELEWLAAVMSLQDPPEETRRLNRTDKQMLEEELRARFGSALEPLGYDMLTTEKALTRLGEVGSEEELSRLCSGADSVCLKDLGQALRVRLFVTGMVVRDPASGEVIMQLRVLDAEKGRFLIGKSMQGKGVDGALADLERKADAFFKELSGRIATKIPFHSQPEGAEVRVDDKVVCKKTPCEPLLAIGDHRIEMRLDRHEAAKTRVFLDKNIEVKLELQPFFGWLTVETEPPGGLVRIDGGAPQRTPVQRREVEPGEHEVVLDDRCFAAAADKAVVARGAEKRVTLKTSAKEARFSVLAVDARGEETDAVARVYADGKALGNVADGPFTVPLCTRTVRVEVNGADPVELPAQLSPDKKNELRAEFPRLYGPSRRRFAVRAGLGTHTGIIGVGAEYRFGLLGVAVGYGSHLTAGLTLGSRRNDGGFYVDAHGALGTRAAETGAREWEPGLGATVGYDLRPLDWLSVKVGAGLAWSPANSGSTSPRLLVLDAAVGPVF